MPRPKRRSYSTRTLVYLERISVPSVTFPTVAGNCVVTVNGARPAGAPANSELDDQVGFVAQRRPAAMYARLIAPFAIRNDSPYSSDGVTAPTTFVIVLTVR